MKIHKY